MKNAKIKQLSKKDSDLISKIESNQSLKAYWKSHPDLAQDFQKLKNGTNTSSYYASPDKPHCLLILRPLHKGKDEPLSPWIDEGESTSWIGILCLAKCKQEELIEILSSYLALSDTPPTLLTDPEVKEGERVEALEQAGFKRVGSLVKGQGFFKGTPHHIMKR